MTSMQALQQQQHQPTLNPNLKDFWLTATTEHGFPVRNRVLKGGRSSSKSWDAAGFAIFLAQMCRVRIMCARQFQNKIAESVYTLLKLRIEEFGLTNEFDILRDGIRHKGTGSEFLFYGLWRHIEEIRSTESIDVLWVEQAEALTEEQWRILEPTIRKEGSQVWIIFNPDLVTDFVWREFVSKGRTDTLVRHINYDENPFLSQTMLDIIERKRQEDEDEYRHIYLGEPRQDDDQVIIKRSWIMAAIDAHKRLGLDVSGGCRVGFDIADSGDDLNATVATFGILTTHVDEWKGGEDELLKSAGRAHALADRMQASIDYDSIGVGAFAGAHFQALNAKAVKDGGRAIDYFKFNAGGKVLNPHQRIDKDDPKAPTNKNFYANLKAQAWWEISRRFRVTFNAITKGQAYKDDDIISISSDIDHLESLVDELSTPRKDYDNAGRSKVESKKDLEAREVPSPNKADAFVMAYAPRRHPAHVVQTTQQAHA